MLPLPGSPICSIPPTLSIITIVDVSTNLNPLFYLSLYCSSRLTILMFLHTLILMHNLSSIHILFLSLIVYAVAGSHSCSRPARLPVSYPISCCRCTLFPVRFSSPTMMVVILIFCRTSHWNLGSSLSRNCRFLLGLLNFGRILC